MQLPRGTFLNIKRSIKVVDLLAELQSMKFTGICTISFGNANGTAVFKSGKHILAEYKDITGDSAWDELLKINGEKVDASLSTLNEMQIQLSFEFNKTYLISKGGKTDNVPANETVTTVQHIIKKPPIIPPEQKPIATKTIPTKQNLPETALTNRPVMSEPLRSSELPRIISDIHLKKAAHKPLSSNKQKPQIFSHLSEEKKPEDSTIVPSDSDPSSFDKDIETFETMDVDGVTDKIRGECKTLIKQLNLEYLAEDYKG
jgi:hypothetical protein